MEENISTNTDPLESTDATSPMAPKRRGRPPKTKLVAEASDDASPKRRKRTTKKTLDATNEAPVEDLGESPAPVSTLPEEPQALVEKKPAENDIPQKATSFSFSPDEDIQPEEKEETSDSQPQKAVLPEATPTWKERGEKWEKRNPPKFNPQDRNNVKTGFQRFQARKQNQQGNTNTNPGHTNFSKPSKPSKKDRFQAGKFNPQGKFEKIKDQENAQKPAWGALANADTMEDASLDMGNSFDYNKLKDESFIEKLKGIAKHTFKTEKLPSPENPEILVETQVPCTAGTPLKFNEIYDLSMPELIECAKSFGILVFRNPQRRPLIRKILNAAFEQNRPVELDGTLEILANGHGLLLYTSDNFKVRELSAFVPSIYVKRFGLQRGHQLSTIVHPPMPGETAPIVVEITSIMGTDPDEIKNLTPFTELTPYYPTERIMLETSPEFANNLSMRCVDLLCPIGLGQRGLIVAPPRVGKTVLLQTMANSILKNKPKAKLIVLLVDERPEEVTDFRRNTPGAEIISSTFDETPENHVHVAEMVIERARRMVELGKDVIILLDSITRLARAYNTLMPNGGKVLSGGVEAGALAKPKRFFGSARNIEDGGSLTILGTALIDTGSKMDEVIFEEFKGTGNMELDLDRDLANKRIFPAINFERSGTRKEELLYHPDEMQYVHSMRRAMKGVPSLEAMEMLITRMKKTKTNIEFLMSLAR